MRHQIIDLGVEFLVLEIPALCLFHNGVSMEWGKCSSRQAASRSISVSLCPLKGIIRTTLGQARVRVPVLSNTMVSARAMVSRKLPALHGDMLPAGFAHGRQYGKRHGKL